MTRRSWFRGLDGWLLIVGGLGMGLVLWLAPAADASSRNGEAQAKRDFDSLVHKVEARYRMHGNSVPMMWVANLFARKLTKGGVQEMKVVEFEDADKIAQASGQPGEFGDLVRTELGERWSPMVRDHQKKGGDSYVYVQSSNDTKNDTKLTRIIVVDLDGAELDMVRVSLDPDQLAKWLKEHDAEPPNGTGTPGHGANDDGPSSAVTTWAVTPSAVTTMMSACSPPWSRTRTTPGSS